MTRAVRGAFRSGVEGQDNVWALDGSAITDEVSDTTAVGPGACWTLVRVTGSRAET